MEDLNNNTHKQSREAVASSRTNSLVDQPRPHPLYIHILNYPPSFPHKSPTRMTATTPLSSSSALLVLLIVLAAVSGEARDPFACDPKDGGNAGFPFCRQDLGIGERVKDLIGRLTVEEKVGLLVNNAAGVPRLGIKGYEWWSEALHGVSNVGPGTKFGGDFPGATSFPQVITTAASFNSSLWEAIGQVSFFLYHILSILISVPHYMSKK